MAKTLGANHRKAMLAYHRARQVGQYYQALLASRMLPSEAMSAIDRWWSSLPDKSWLGLSKDRSSIASARSSTEVLGNSDRQIRLAVVGYPYMIHDEYVNCGLLANLKRLGATILTPDMVPIKARQAQAMKQPKYLFWYYSNQVIRATYYFFQEKMIDGLIHVTAFACGPDAMVSKLLELDCRKHDRLPYLSLCLDEHTGVAGVMTRLEAFIDMLVRRKGGSL